MRNSIFNFQYSISSFKILSAFIRVHSWLKTLCAFVALCLCAFSSPAAERIFNETWDMSLGPAKRLPLKWFQTESIELNLAAIQNGSPVDLSATNIICVWEIYGWNDFTNIYAVSIGNITDGANGATQFRLTPEWSNLPRGHYLGVARALADTAGTFTEIGVLCWMTIEVEWSPDSRFFPTRGPLTYPIEFSDDAITNYFWTVSQFHDARIVELQGQTNIWNAAYINTLSNADRIVAIEAAIGDGYEAVSDALEQFKNQQTSTNAALQTGINNNAFNLSDLSDTVASSSAAFAGFTQNQNATNAALQSGITNNTAAVSNLLAQFSEFELQQAATNETFIASLAGKVDSENGTMSDVTSSNGEFYSPVIFNGSADSFDVFDSLTVGGRPYDLTFNLSQLQDGTFITSPNSARGWDGTGWIDIDTNITVFAHPTTFNPAERTDLTYSIPKFYYDRLTFAFDGFASAGLTNSSLTNLHGIFQEWSRNRFVFRVNTKASSMAGFGGWKAPSKTNIVFDVFDSSSTTPAGANQIYSSLVAPVPSSESLLNTNGFTIIIKQSGGYGNGMYLTFSDASQTVFKMGFGNRYPGGTPFPLVWVGSTGVSPGSGPPMWFRSGAGILKGLIAYRFIPAGVNLTTVECYRILPNEPETSANWGLHSTATLSARIPADIGAVIIGQTDIVTPGLGLAANVISQINLNSVLIFDSLLEPVEMLEVNEYMSKRHIWNLY